MPAPPPRSTPDGRYQRVLPVSLARLYENRLDWARLPHVHHREVAGLRCLAWADWGWRVALTDPGGRERVLELQLDRRSRSWVTRVLEGPEAGTGIRSRVEPLGPVRVAVTVEFHVAGAAEAERLIALCARLYDADEVMMVERQRQLDRRVDRARDHERVLGLGPRQALQLPMNVELAGREFVLAESAGALVAFPRQCPHQLGPLTADRLDGGVVTCPWHGYRYDVRTGDNLAGRGCRLSHLPVIEIDDDGAVRLVATH